MNIVEKLIDGKNRPHKIREATLKVIIHYTANYGKGANANANVNYIDSVDNASCHYFIDDKNILLAVPCEEVAFHVGAKSYLKAGNDLIKRGYQPNYCTVGIEMCVNSDGDFEKVKELTKKLTLKLLYKYNLTPDDILRHYDITGKMCPAMFVEDEIAWKLFIEDIRDMYIGYGLSTQYAKGTIVTSGGNLNIRKEPNSSATVIGSYKNGETINIVSETGDWIQTEMGYVSAKYVAYDKTSVNVKGVITTSGGNLNIRKEPNSSATVIGSYKNGETINILKEENEWIQTEIGYVSAKYVTKK